MNKRFTLLMASVFAVVLSLSMTPMAYAQDDDIYLASGSNEGLYQLVSEDDYILSISEDGEDDVIEGISTTDFTSSDLGSTLFCVTVEQESQGQSYKFDFTNKIGKILALDQVEVENTVAYDNTDTDGTTIDAVLGYDIMGWAFSSTISPVDDEGGYIYSYFTTDSIVGLKMDGETVYMVKGLASEIDDMELTTFTLETADEIEISSASDFNTVFGTQNSMLGVALTFEPEVLGTTLENPFNGKLSDSDSDTHRIYAAESGDDNYMYIYKYNDQYQAEYLYVDTAYTNTVGNTNFLGYNWSTSISSLLAESYKFLLTYYPSQDSLLIQVAEVYYGVDDDEDGIYNWSEDNGASFLSDVTTVEDAYISLQELVTDQVRILTVGQDADDPQNTKISLGFAGCDANDDDRTTVADGVYLIQNITPNSDNYGQYAIANLAGVFGWAEEQENQDFDHMPATQWVVTKKNSTETSRITIVNREFPDADASDVLSTSSIQLYADAQGGTYYYNNGSAVYLTFTAIDDASDVYLGYKHVTETEASVQTYTFNYLHGLSLEKYLYTSDDNGVGVDADGEKTTYRLSVVVEDDAYGYNDGLIRNVYTVASMDGDAYLTYDTLANQYVMGSEPGYFFLKENNCVASDTTHYYALVEANFLKVKVTTKTIYDPSYAGQSTSEATALASDDYAVVYDEDGVPFIADGSTIDQPVYAYQDVDGVVALNELTKDDDEETAIVNLYYYAPDNEDANAYGYVKVAAAEDDSFTGSSTGYATVKASVDDNTLDLVEGVLDDKFISEVRTSAFAVEVDDSPLYRHFNNTNLGENADDSADSIYFVESIRGEYLMDETNETLLSDEVDYAGIWDVEKADGKLAFRIDTAWLNRGNGLIKPQYLISAYNDVIEGEYTVTTPCDETTEHIKAIYDEDGNITGYEATDDPYECIHATTTTYETTPFVYGKYLINFSDFAAACTEDVNPYLFNTTAASNSSYTRVGFMPGIHVGDDLYILTGAYADYTAEEIAEEGVNEFLTDYAAAYPGYIYDLTGDEHKNVTWSFRYITPDDAADVEEEGDANSFLIESNVYGSADNGYQTVYGDATRAIAPTDSAAWLKMHNGCLVLTDAAAEFSSAKTGGDGALVFNAYQKTDAEDMVTSTEDIEIEGVTVIAGDGTVTIKGASGKSVMIANILGKVVASTTLTSDSQTISVPAGIVVVAVEGEDAVKTVVK